MKFQQSLIRAAHRTLLLCVLRPMRIPARAFSLFLCAFLLSVTSSSLLAQTADSKGTDFWLMFNENLSGSGELVDLYIAGDVATTGTVAIPGLAFTQSFSVTPGSVTTVTLPLAVRASGVDSIENKGVHVTAVSDVTVYGLNRRAATTDAFLGLPVDILGTEYINLGYRNVNVVNATQFGVVASQNATTVTIVPTVAAGSGRVAGTAYTITLNQGQTYQLRSTLSEPADLTGTIITSDKPIAVFGSHQCANIPSGSVACDHIVEQLPPTATWGRNFVSIPLATRRNGDTFRILASTNGTTVSVNGTVVANLNRGQFHERLITGSAQIVANNPVLVAQYSNSSSFDGITSDPFMMLIPPFEQFLGSYTITTPATGFATNFVNVVTPSAGVGNILLDGSPIPAASFTAIGTSGFSGTQVPISTGSHNLAGTSPFGVFVYGYASFDSYGYPGGFALGQVAVVTSIDVIPPTATATVGTQRCTDALVADQNGNPLNGVRVDFSVTGVNAASGFAFTGANGIATFCYVGTNAGVDTVRASVGALFDTGTITWQRGGDTIPPQTTCAAIVVASGRLLTLGATDNMDPNPSIFIMDSAAPSFIAGPFRSTDQIHVRTVPTTVARSQVNLTGTIKARVQLHGTALIFATDAAGNSSTPVPCP